jgi:large subunit ribosomal protein L23
MNVIKYPFITEKATLHLDEDNKLQFIVDINATKTQIKKQIEKTYNVEVADVNTMITPKGKKKAIVTFTKEGTASELASRFGIF